MRIWILARDGGLATFLICDRNLERMRAKHKVLYINDAQSIQKEEK